MPGVLRALPVLCFNNNLFQTYVISKSFNRLNYSNILKSYFIINLPCSILHETPISSKLFATSARLRSRPIFPKSPILGTPELYTTSISYHLSSWFMISVKERPSRLKYPLFQDITFSSLTYIVFQSLPTCVCCPGFKIFDRVAGAEPEILMEPSSKVIFD